MGLNQSGARWRNEDGAVAFAVGLVAVLVTVALVLASVGVLVAKHRHVSNAADLAALAAASALQQGNEACAMAATIAERNDVRLESCVVEGQQVVVQVVASLNVAGRKYPLQGRSTAGPVE